MPFEYVIEDQHDRREGRAARREPSADELAAREAERHAKRGEIKNKIAAGKIAERRHAEIELAIERERERKDSMADDCAAAVAPLRQQLEEIERQLVASIVGKHPHDEELESRRAGVLTEIRGHTADLESRAADIDRNIALLEVERFEAARACVTSTAHDLVKLGRADLVIALRVAESARDWASARLSSAEEKLRRRPGDEFLLAEVTAAREAVELATSRHQQAFAAVVDE